MTIFDLTTDSGLTLGLRGGYWLESLPFLGFGVDLFHFSLPIPAQTATATGFAAILSAAAGVVSLERTPAARWRGEAGPARTAERLLLEVAGVLQRIPARRGN